MILNCSCSFRFKTRLCACFGLSGCWHVCPARPDAGPSRFGQSALFPRVRVGFISFCRRRFTLMFMLARLSLDQRGIWHDDELLAYVEIGIGTHIALNFGTLRIEDALQLVADARADHKADN